MISASSQRVEPGTILGWLLTFLLLLAQALPVSSWGSLPIYPYVGLLAVYYWSVFTPHNANPFVLFAFGIVQDVLSGSPLGMHAALYILLRALIISQRRLFLAQQFLFVWAGMLLTLLLAHVFHLVVLQLANIAPAPFATFLWPACTTLLVYPLWHKCMDLMYQKREGR